MEIHQIRYFVATAECESVSRAASQCRVAQPSLSQQLKKLEDHLRVKLFDRLGRGVVLTDAGRAFLPRAKRILMEIQAAEANIEEEADQGSGPLRIGAIPTMAPYLLPKVLKQLRSERNRGEILIREGFTEKLVDLVVDNEIDCAIVSTPLAHDLLDVEVIGAERLFLVEPATETISSGKARLGTLENEPTIVLEDIHCLGRQIEGFCSSLRLTPRIVCRTAQLSTIFELVALGVGISVVPEMAIASSPHKKCVFSPLKQKAASREIALIWRKGRSRSAGCRRFAELLQENLKSGMHSFMPPKEPRFKKYS